MPRRIRRRAAIVRLFCIALLICSACSPHIFHTASCSQPPAGIGPNASGTLQNEDNGKSYCIHVGEIITVFLRVPLSQLKTMWGVVTVSGSSLEPMSNGVMTLVRGVRGAVYKAAAPGTAVLQSKRGCSGCTPSSWSATIVVR
ncbi:MAG: hypothetical protein ACYDCC_05830 [Actinomycetota bacterium]